MTSNDRHSQLVSYMKEAEEGAANEESLFLVQLVTAAALDDSPEYTLKEVHEALLESRSWELLDPLNLFPLLITSKKDDASDLIWTISQEGNPRETIIAVQEALEGLEKDVHSDYDADGDGRKYASELVCLLIVCENTIPRLKLRKKGPAETLRPVLTHLGTVIDAVAPPSSGDDGRLIISSITRLIKAVLPWLSLNADKGEAEYKATTELLSQLLRVALSACAGHIRTCLAQRRFETSNPRLVLRSAVDSDAQRSEDVIQKTISVARSLGITSGSLINEPPSIPQLVIVAHDLQGSLPLDFGHVEKLLPILMSSFQRNIAWDESLAILLTSLSSPSSGSAIPEELVNSIAPLLTSLASTHSHPPTRHVAFRILALLLSRTPSPVHLAHLSSLLTDCPFPQMRVAAVGLVKEAFLDAINSMAKSPFTSSTLIRVFGPILFKPDPVDVLSSPTDASLKEFLESSEPARLTECLAFYYVLLKRDTNNLSGVRDRDMLKTVENGLLAPLRRALSTWLENFSSISDPHALMPLASLETSLERVDGAIVSLKLPEC